MYASSMSKVLIRLALATVLSTGLSSHAAIAQTPDDHQHPQPSPTPPTEERQLAEPPPADLAQPLSRQQGPGPVTRTGFHAYVYSVAHAFGAMPTMKSTYAVLSGTGLLALAVHNEDTHVNTHFQGGNTKFFASGKYLGQSYT